MSKKANKEPKEKRGFLEYLAVRTELPSDALAGDIRIEIRGRNTLFMQGCRRILKYSPEEMILAAKGLAVRIRGRRLICSTYHDGTVTIDGSIIGVDLDCEKGEPRE